MELTDLQCQWGGQNLRRCPSKGTALVKVANGKLRVRCQEHVNGVPLAEPHEVESYLNNRAWKGRP